MIPTGKHNDWWWPFSYIPRSWTAFEWRPPFRLLGNGDTATICVKQIWYKYFKPVPSNGQFQVSFPPYFAVQVFHHYFAIGIRFDDIDMYYTWPRIAFKHYRNSK